MIGQHFQWTMTKWSCLLFAPHDTNIQHFLRDKPADHKIQTIYTIIIHNVHVQVAISELTCAVFAIISRSRFWFLSTVTRLDSHVCSNDLCDSTLVYHIQCICQCTPCRSTTLCNYMILLTEPRCYHIPRHVFHSQELWTREA